MVWGLRQNMVTKMGPVRAKPCKGQVIDFCVTIFERVFGVYKCSIGFTPLYPPPNKKGGWYGVEDTMP